MTDSESWRDLTFVLTTEENYKKAVSLANQILKKKLVACVSFHQIQSCFWWEGKIKQSEEIQIVMKTKYSNLQATLDMIKILHSYQIPEVISFPAFADKSYGKWIDDCTR